MKIPLRILLVEDNTGTCARLKNDLEMIYEHIDATTGIDAANLKLLEIKAYSPTTPYDLLLMDLNMNCYSAQLTKDEQDTTNNSYITGWVWSYKRIISIDEYIKSNLRIMFLSPYLYVLDEYFQTEKHKSEIANKNIWIDQDRMKYIPKEVAENSCSKLIEEINKWWGYQC